MDIDFLRKVSLFKGLNEGGLKALAELCFTREFAKEGVIILAEQEGDTLFIIREGQVKVCISNEEGREVILSLLGPGAVFGELALLDGKLRSANVVATDDTSLIMLRRSDFQQLIYKTPQIAMALLAELAGRLRRTDRQIEGLALLDVTSRISETLLQLADDQGKATAEGIAIDSRPTHQEIANMSGTTRETVSRALKRLEGQGYISCRGRKIIILRENNWSRTN